MQQFLVSIVVKPSPSTRTGGPARVLTALVPNATGATTADGPHRRTGLCKLIPIRHVIRWSKSNLPLRRTLQLVLSGTGVGDTARVPGVNRKTVSAHFKKTGPPLR